MRQRRRGGRGGRAKGATVAAGHSPDQDHGERNDEFGARHQGEARLLRPAGCEARDPQREAPQGEGRPHHGSHDFRDKIGLGVRRGPIPSATRSLHLGAVPYTPLSPRLHNGIAGRGPCQPPSRFTTPTTQPPSRVQRLIRTHSWQGRSNDGLLQQQSCPGGQGRGAAPFSCAESRCALLTHGTQQRRVSTTQSPMQRSATKSKVLHLPPLPLPPVGVLLPRSTGPHRGGVLDAKTRSLR